MAEPVPTCAKEFDRSLLEKIKKEVPSSHSNALAEKLQWIIEKEESIQEQYREYHRPYKEQLHFFKEAGFRVVKSTDITQKVLPFYQKIKTAICNLLESETQSPTTTTILLIMLAVFYLRFSSFKTGLEQYRLIKAVKTNSSFIS